MIYEGYKFVFCWVESACCMEFECHACLHRNAALMGLCYICKSTRAVKQLPTNLHDPLTTRHGFSRATVPAGKNWQACIISNFCQRSLYWGSQNPPSVRSSWLHTCYFLISRGSSWSCLVETFDGIKVNAVCTICCRQLEKRDKSVEWFEFGWRQQHLL